MTAAPASDATPTARSIAARPRRTTHPHRSLMFLRSRHRWFAALLLAVLQLARIGAECMDDARLALASAAPIVVHVEEQGGSGHCPPVHPANCAICSALATPALPATSQCPPAPSTVRAVQPPTAVVPLTGARSRHLPDSRAPPLA